MPHWSRGLGRLILNQKDTSSNLVCGAVCVAQLVERRVVVAEVADSSSVAHSQPPARGGSGYGEGSYLVPHTGGFPKYSQTPGG